MNINETVKKYIPEGSSAEIFGHTVLFKIAPSEIKKVCSALSAEHGLPLKTIVAEDNRNAEGVFKIFYVFGVPKVGIFLAPYITLSDTEEFPSIADTLYQASLYEPRIKEMFGLTPVGYPVELQRVVLHNEPSVNIFPLRKDAATARTGNKDDTYEHVFLAVGGEGMYEVPVGPVHAGIIEPGHFRFSMAGEVIVNLEARLGWVHKGTEKLFETKSLPEKLLLSERVAGDTSFAHSLAFCQAVEELADINIPERAKYLRVVFGELERLANHLNDIGFILSDTGLNFGGANGTRLRERIMQLNERITGSRFLRGVNVIGGVTVDMNEVRTTELQDELTYIEKELTEILSIASRSSILLNRLQGTGVLTKEIAEKHDAVGVPARASGMSVDARVDFPYAAYDKLPITIAIETSGDVYGRYNVRIKEVYAAIALVREAIHKMPKGIIAAPVNDLKLKSNSYAVGVTEGWRGEVLYFVATDKTGEISRVAVRDPSLINWNLIPHAAPGNVLLDFPLINKSFNLSYSGNDL